VPLTAAPEKVLDTVRKLIQRSASTNRAEAEQAAYMACRLIRTAGLEIVNPPEIDLLLQENEDLKQKVLQLETGDDDDDDDWTVPAPAPMARPVVTAPPVGPYANPLPASLAMPPPPMAKPIRLVSKYRGHCKRCGQTYNVGDDILWQKGVGSWCATTGCYTDWVNLSHFHP
jgi:hypothetical protein